MTPTIPPVPAAKLAVGDRLTAGLILGGQPADIIFVHNYELRTARWTFVAARIAFGLRTGDIEAAHFRADALIGRDAAAETPAHFLQPAPIAAHYEAVDRPGEVECACGEVFAADTTAEAGELLRVHASELNTPIPLVHMGTAVGGTVCGRPVAAAERVSLVWLYVTCRACIDGPEATPPLHTVARAADTVPVPAEDATLTQLVEPEPRTELLAIVPTADGSVTTLAPVGAVTDPVRRAHVVELTEAVAEQLDATAFPDEPDDACHCGDPECGSC